MSQAAIYHRNRAPPTAVARALPPTWHVCSLSRPRLELRLQTRVSQALPVQREKRP